MHGMVRPTRNNTTVMNVKSDSRLKVMVYGHRNMTLTLKTTNTTVARQHPIGNCLLLVGRGDGLTLYLQVLIPVWPQCPGLANEAIAMSKTVKVVVRRLRIRTGVQMPIEFRFPCCGMLWGRSCGERCYWYLCLKRRFAIVGLMLILAKGYDFIG